MIQKKIIGLITDGDLRRGLKKHPATEWSKLKAENLMTYDPITISKNTLAIEALKLMENNRKKSIGILPIVNKDMICLGLLRLHDLIQSGLSN